MTQSQFLGNKAEQDCAAVAVVDSILKLTGNIFSENVAAGDGAGLCLERIAEGSSITYNTVTGNRSQKAHSPSIIYLRAGRLPVFVQNNISDNIGYDLVNNGPLPIQASHNWWGTTDEGAIRARIFNRPHGGSTGEVLISPPLTAPVKVPDDPSGSQ